MATEEQNKGSAGKKGAANTQDIPLRETLRLPDMVPMPKAFREGLGRGPDAGYLEPGLYDGFGRKLGELDEIHDQTRVVVQFAGVTFIWGVFGRRLEAGRQGWLHFENVPGTAPITAFFNEWDRDTGLPTLEDAMLPLISAQRGRDEARVVGRNDGGSAVWAAAGFIVAQDLDLPPAKPAKEG